MVEIANLAVSLTKNGYLKIWRLAKKYPSHEILDHVFGAIPGVKLQRSQVRNILSADPVSETVPAFWDEIRRHSDETIKAFTFLAVIYSHHRLIDALLDAGGGSPEGHIARGDVTEKEFTNLVYAMAELGLCEYKRGAPAVDYDLRPLKNRLRPARQLVDKLLRSKLARCGWKDPDEFRASNDPTFLIACCDQRFHAVLGMSFSEFSKWITGRSARPR